MRGSNRLVLVTAIGPASRVQGLDILTVELNVLVVKQMGSALHDGMAVGGQVPSLDSHL